LRQEAWSAAGRSSGSLTDAVLHLVSQLVQEELATIAMAIETSTLDVERKHNLDRRSEARTVASVAKASRDGFVRHWRAESRAAASTAKAHKELRAQKFVNKVSIAYERGGQTSSLKHMDSCIGNTQLRSAGGVSAITGGASGS
jgi:prephenate dehydratase